MKRRDWALLAINAAGAQGLSPVQLQKTLFLLGREMPSAVEGTEFYSFKPYHYGPFDRAVYVDAEELAQENKIEIIQGESWNRYVPTRDGEIAASWLAREAPEATEYVSRLVEWVQRQTFQSLVSAIYKRHPDMKVNSVFRG